MSSDSDSDSDVFSGTVPNTSYSDVFSGTVEKSPYWASMMGPIEREISRIKRGSIHEFYFQISKVLDFWWKSKSVDGTFEWCLDGPNVSLQFIDGATSSSIKFIIYISYYGCEVTVKYENWIFLMTNAGIKKALGIIEECARTTPLSRYGYTRQSCELTMDVEALAALTDHNKSHNNDTV